MIIISLKPSLICKIYKIQRSASCDEVKDLRVWSFRLIMYSVFHRKNHFKTKDEKNKTQ